MNSELLYSVVIPCYKSDHTLHKVISLTIDELEKLNITKYEFILVNDCSPDDGKTWEKIKELAKEYDCVKGLNLARNFGQHNAIIA